MIAIPTQHRAQVLLVPVGKDQMKVERSLLALPRVEHFVHHQNAHSIGELQQLGHSVRLLPADAWPVYTGSNHDAGRLATRLQEPITREQALTGMVAFLFRNQSVRALLGLVGCTSRNGGFSTTMKSSLSATMAYRR